MGRETPLSSYYRIISPRDRTPALLGKQCGGGVYVNLGCEVVEIDAAVIFSDQMMNHKKNEGQTASQGAVRPNTPNKPAGSGPRY